MKTNSLLVYNKLAALISQKCRGEDSLDACLHRSADVVTTPVTHIFNSKILEGHGPSDLIITSLMPSLHCVIGRATQLINLNISINLDFLNFSLKLKDTELNTLTTKSKIIRV